LADTTGSGGTVPWRGGFADVDARRHVALMGHGRAFGGGVGFGMGAGAGCTGVDSGCAGNGAGGARLLAAALPLTIATISASIVLSWTASRWEIASSVALVSSNFTPNAASAPFIFAASWSMRAFNRLIWAPRTAKAGDHYDEYDDDDEAEATDGNLQLP
jgi:uncharacterized membrane protein YedE/YeeE